MEKKSLRRADFLFFIGYAAYVFIYLTRMNLSIAASSLESAGLLSVSQIGIMGSVFSICYALGRIINSSIGDRTVPYILFCTGLAGSGLSNVLEGFFPPFLFMALLWGLNAWAASMLWGAEMRAICLLYDETLAKKRSTWMGSAVTAGTLAGILFNTWLVNRFDVRFAFIVPGVFNLCMSVVMFIFFRPVRDKAPIQAKKLSYFALFKDKSVLRMVFPSMCHGIIKDNINLWMALFFVRTYAIDLASSAWFLFLIPAVGMLGRLIYPTVYRLCRQSECSVAALGFAVSLLCCVLLFFCPLSPLLAALCLSVIYAAISMSSTSFLAVFPMRFTKSNQVASVSGVMDFAAYVGSSLSATIYGVLLEASGFGIMFLSWIFLSALSAVLLYRAGKKL